MAQEAFGGDLKIVILNSDASLIPKLNKDHANKLPQPFLDRIKRVSTVQSYGDITIWTVKEAWYYGDISRVVGWVIDGTRAPFLHMNGALTIRKPEGDRQPVNYDPKVHEHDFSFVTTTMTRQYFVEDIDRYMCSIRVNLPDMRAFLSERLRSYPMYVAEMVKLLTTLYARDDISKGVDPDLAKFILQRVTSCKRSLIKDKQLGTFLRERFEGKAKIEALLRYSETSQDDLTRIVQSMERNIGDAPTTAALLSAFLESHLAARDPTLRLPSGPAAHASPKHSIDAESVHAMYDKRRLLVAKQDYVHGTMRVDSTGAACSDPRNKAFGFSRGDLLVDVTEERLVERYRPNSIVLQNQRKEVGEINYDPGVLVELHHLVGEKGAWI